MTPRRPLVHISGDAAEMPTGDTLDPAVIPATSSAWNLAAGEQVTIPANRQIAFPAGLTSAEPTGVVAIIDGIGVS